MPSHAVALDRVTVRYGERVALEDVSLEIGAGQLVGVIGPNGAGKSTLFKALLGVLSTSAGRIEVADRSTIAYVPQREHVAWSFPISAEEVVLLGSYRRVGWLRRPGAAERGAARAALDEVGLRALRGSQIGRLSGGQQQLVFIARALLQLGDWQVSPPRLMLLDEPLAGVDPTNADLVLELLRRVASAGHTVLMSTHDLNVAAATCDRLLLLNRVVTGYGTALDVFTPDVLARTYGGHALMFSTPAMQFGVPDDGAHHRHAH